MLFLVVDDLRPKLGCYGESNMVTPNIDQLAAKSVRFDRAYVQVRNGGWGVGDLDLVSMCVGTQTKIFGRISESVSLETDCWSTSRLLFILCKPAPLE